MLALKPVYIRKYISYNLQTKPIQKRRGEKALSTAHIKRNLQSRLCIYYVSTGHWPSNKPQYCTSMKFEVFL